MATPIQQLFEELWNDYVAITPCAKQVASFLAQRGERIVNDHIALRTFSHPRVGIEVLAKAFVQAGYQRMEDYRFEDKKLNATYYDHIDPKLPKVFISELEIHRCSEGFQQIVEDMLTQLPEGEEFSEKLPAYGRPWNISFQEYQRLLKESQYGAWLAAFGFRANHFTVATQSLKSVSSLSQLNEVLLSEGFELNKNGGVIKGSSQIGLEQSSTMAEQVDVVFSDKTAKVPSCYYEFAYRHPKSNGELFGGFIADSATHLFTSTDTK